MLQRRNTLLAKIESVYGTDSNPTVSTNAVSVFDLSVKPDGDKLERNDLNGYLSPAGHAIGQKWVSLSFSVNGRGSGTAGTPPEIAALLKSCGLGETINTGVSVEYLPISSGFGSCTIYAYMDGIIHKVTGCRGSVDITCEAGQYIKFGFKMTGRWQTPSDLTFAAGTYSQIAAPVVLSAGFTVGDYSAVITNLHVGLNNEIAKLRDMNSSGRIEITGRKPSGSFDPEAVTEGAKAFWANWENSVAEAMTLTIGSAGNRIRLDMPKAVYDSISWGDKEGVRKYEIPFTAVRNTGDDELKITFS